MSFVLKCPVAEKLITKRNQLKRASYLSSYWKTRTVLCILSYQLYLRCFNPSRFHRPSTLYFPHSINFFDSKDFAFIFHTFYAREFLRRCRRRRRRPFQRINEWDARSESEWSVVEFDEDKKPLCWIKIYPNSKRKLLASSWIALKWPIWLVKCCCYCFKWRLKMFFWWFRRMLCTYEKYLDVSLHF